MSEKLSALDFLKLNGNSKYKEILAEYTFLKDLLLSAAINNEKLLVSRSDFDDFGFDVLIGSLDRKQVLNVQLKSFAGVTKDWDVHKSLIENENGRVVIIKLLEGEGDIEFEYYRLKKDKKDAVKDKNPVSKHLAKCRVNLHDCELLTKDNLLSIFEY